MLSDPEISPYDRGQLAKPFLELSYDSSATATMLPKAEWLELVAGLFEEYLQGGKISSYNELMSFYYLNKSGVEPGTDRIIINPKASQAFKDHLLNHPDSFALYVKHLIRPEMQPFRSGEALVFEPFLRQIFVNWEDFKAHLSQHQPTDSLTQHIRRLTLAHIDDYYSSTPRFVLKSKADEKAVLTALEIVSTGK